MARWKNFRKYGVRSSAKYFGGRAYSRGRKMYKGGGGSVIFAGAGVVAGVMAPRIHPLQDAAITAIAVLPGVLPLGRTIPWQIRRFASGYVMGAMARPFVGGLGLPASSGGIQYG